MHSNVPGYCKHCSTGTEVEEILSIQVKIFLYFYKIARNLNYLKLFLKLLVSPRTPDPRMGEKNELYNELSEVVLHGAGLEVRL